MIFVPLLKNNYKMDLCQILSDGTITVETPDDLKEKKRIESLPFLEDLREIREIKEIRENKEIKEIREVKKSNEPEITPETLIAGFSIEKLLGCIKTASYICFDMGISDLLIEEFLWKIGEDSKTFLEFFNTDLVYIGKDREIGLEIKRFLRRYTKTDKTRKRVDNARYSIRFTDDLRDIGINACICGNLRLFKYALKKNPTRSDDLHRYICTTVKHDQLHILKYTMETDFFTDASIRFDPFDIEKDEWVDYLYYCARFGSINCLKYFSEKKEFGEYVDSESRYVIELLTFAAEYGHINIIEHLCEILRKYRSETELKSENITKYAARNEKVDCLRYLHENGWRWNSLTTSTAICYGRFDCLKYAVENGCPVTTRGVDTSVNWDDLSCLKYLVEKKYFPSSEAFIFLSRCKPRDINRFFFNYLIEIGCPANLDVVKTFIRERNMKAVKKLVKAGVPLTADFCYSAARYGFCPCLEYCFAKGVKPDEKMFEIAVEYSKFSCIKFLIRKNCPFNRVKVQESLARLKKFKEKREIVKAVEYYLSPHKYS